MTLCASRLAAWVAADRAWMVRAAWRRIATEGTPLISTSGLSGPARTLSNAWRQTSDQMVGVRVAGFAAKVIAEDD